MQKKIEISKAKKIKQIVETFYNIEDVSIKTRDLDFVNPRRITAYLIRRFTILSDDDICIIIGKHRTAINRYVNCITKQYMVNGLLRKEIESLINICDMQLNLYSTRT